MNVLVARREELERGLSCQYCGSPFYDDQPSCRYCGAPRNNPAQTEQMRQELDYVQYEIERTISGEWLYE